MKKIFLTILVACSILAACNNEKKSEAGDTVKASLEDIKEHKCNDRCLGDYHEYLHNELKHTCTSECGVPHKCGDKCSGETHVYAHGEMLHYCLCKPAK